jgi:N-acetylmuramoyl-L-alanine amidase
VIAQSASPNFNERRGGALPSLIVLHYTAMDSCAAAHARLCDPAHEVSAHWLISEQGAVYALVPEAARAWHAGAGSWGGLTDINSHSIGIELANRADHPFPQPQMTALETLLREIMARWNIPPQRVIAHSDMAPERKGDPGARFDWRRLALQGLGVWPDQLGDPARALNDSLTAIGYPDTPARLAAFRLRFRPWAQGAEQPEDRAIADALAQIAAALNAAT